MIPLLVFSNLCMFMNLSNFVVVLTRWQAVNEGMGYHLYDINFSSISQATRLAIWCQYRVHYLDSINQSLTPS